MNIHPLENKIKIGAFLRSQLPEQWNGYIPLIQFYKILQKDIYGTNPLLQKILSEFLYDTDINTGENVFELIDYMNNRKAILVNKKAIPFFIKNRFNELIDLNISPHILNSILSNQTIPQKQKDEISLYQLLMPLTRQNRFFYDLLTKDVLKKMLSDTYEKNGITYPLVIKARAGSHRPSFFVNKEAVGIFLQKWGKYFSVPSHLIQRGIDGVDLPLVNDQMISIQDFCHVTKSPLSLAFWIEKNHQDMGLKETDALVFAKNYLGQKHLYLYRDKAAQFIEENMDILSNYGLNKHFIQHIPNIKVYFISIEPIFLSSIEKKIYPKKNQKISIPYSEHIITIDKLITEIKKTTAFIPELREYIIKNAINDKFPLTLENGTILFSPIFSYESANRSTPTLYTHKKGIPYFIQNHLSFLLKNGCPLHFLQDEMDKKNLPIVKGDDLQPFNHLYYTLLPNISLDEFNKRLSSLKNKTYSVELSDGTNITRPFIVEIQFPLSKKEKIYRSALCYVIKKYGKFLGANDNQINRALFLITHPEEKEITPISTFLTALEITSGYTQRFKKQILEENKSTLFKDSKTNKIIAPFESFASNSNLSIGINLKAYPLIAQKFKEKLLTLGANPKKLQEMIDGKPIRFMVNTHKYPSILLNRHLCNKSQQKTD